MKTFTFRYIDNITVNADSLDKAIKIAIEKNSYIKKDNLHNLELLNIKEMGVK